MKQNKNEDRFTLNDFEEILENTEAMSTNTFTFFAYWSWWEALGRPKDFYGWPMYVYCSQDGKYHSPEEIKEYGFCQLTRDSWWHIDPSTERMDNCPIVPIHDHGDLVDRDKLYVNTMDYCDLEEKILNAPAVIPAERSEE